MDSKDEFVDVIEDCTGMASLVSENCMVLAYIVYDFTWGSSESVQRTSIRFPDGSQYAIISETSGGAFPGPVSSRPPGLSWMSPDCQSRRSLMCPRNYCNPDGYVWSDGSTSGDLLE